MYISYTHTCIFTAVTWLGGPQTANSVLRDCGEGQPDDLLSLDAQSCRNLPDYVAMPYEVELL